MMPTSCVNFMQDSCPEEILREESANSGKKHSLNVLTALNFLQNECSSFERLKAAWEIQSADYQVKIAHLEGEKKMLLNMNRDSLRRIKMLENSLREARSAGNEKLGLSVHKFICEKCLVSFPSRSEAGCEFMNGENEEDCHGLKRRTDSSLSILRNYLCEVEMNRLRLEKYQENFVKQVSFSLENLEIDCFSQCGLSENDGETPKTSEITQSPPKAIPSDFDDESSSPPSNFIIKNRPAWLEALAAENHADEQNETMSDLTPA
eukprot:Sdes_comp19856_c0_seq1m12101